MTTNPSDANPAGPVNPPPQTDPVPTPPAQPAAPPAPPAQSTRTTAGEPILSTLQQSIDGLPETFISGMKEAFPVLSQPPAAVQDQQAAQTGQQAASTVEDTKDGRSWLARKWFG